jgi:hypothetical protein
VGATAGAAAVVAAAGDVVLLLRRDTFRLYPAVPISSALELLLDVTSVIGDSCGGAVERDGCATSVMFDLSRSKFSVGDCDDRKSSSSSSLFDRATRYGSIGVDTMLGRLLLL